MNYEVKEATWYPVDIHTRDVNGKRIMHRIPDISLVCEFVEAIENPDEEEILAVFIFDTCIYSKLGNDPITWDDIVGFFA
jgi:hypothetical protein